MLDLEKELAVTSTDPAVRSIDGTEGISEATFGETYEAVENRRRLAGQTWSEESAFNDKLNNVVDILKANGFTPAWDTSISRSSLPKYQWGKFESDKQRGLLALDEQLREISESLRYDDDISDDLKQIKPFDELRSDVASDAARARMEAERTLQRASSVTAMAAEAASGTKQFASEADNWAILVGTLPVSSAAAGVNLTRFGASATASAFAKYGAISATEGTIAYFSERHVQEQMRGFYRRQGLTEKQADDEIAQYSAGAGIGAAVFAPLLGLGAAGFKKVLGHFRPEDAARLSTAGREEAGELMAEVMNREGVKDLTEAEQQSLRALMEHIRSENAGKSLKGRAATLGDDLQSGDPARIRAAVDELQEYREALPKAQRAELDNISLALRFEDVMPSEIRTPSNLALFARVQDDAAARLANGEDPFKVREIVREQLEASGMIDRTITREELTTVTQDLRARLSNSEAITAEDFHTVLSRQEFEEFQAKLHQSEVRQRTSLSEIGQQLADEMKAYNKAFSRSVTDKSPKARVESANAQHAALLSRAEQLSETDRALLGNVVERLGESKPGTKIDMPKAPKAETTEQVIEAKLNEVEARIDTAPSRQAPAETPTASSVSRVDSKALDDMTKGQYSEAIDAEIASLQAKLEKTKLVDGEDWITMKKDVQTLQDNIDELKAVQSCLVG